MMKKSEEETMGHEFDGIEEFDNDLPPWWLNMFYVTIVFAVIYMIYYHILGKQVDQKSLYAEEVKAANELYKDKQPNAASLAMLVAHKDRENLEAGALLFATNCSPCHGEHAEGIVGPNLTDTSWIHGPRFVNILTTITNGVPDKGMVTWNGVLTPEQIHQVASYVVSLQGSHPANGLVPQGEVYPAEEVGK